MKCFFFQKKKILFKNIVFKKAPVPIKPWFRVHNAENYGRKCPTFDDLNGMTENERKNSGDLEDCLNMAIYTTDVREKFGFKEFVDFSSAFDVFPQNSIFFSTVRRIAPCNGVHSWWWFLFSQRRRISAKLLNGTGYCFGGYSISIGYSW